ncbi:MAG: hypothetical protein U1F98_13285 [Verrucomicrobiota bacterium]
MTHGKTSYDPCRPTGKSAGEPSSLEGIVEAYLRDHADAEARYLRFYRVQKSLPAAISKAALAQLPNGARFSHQRRIPAGVLAQTREAMLKLDYRGITSFAALYDKVAAALRPIRGIGLLTIYDTVHRLGAYLELSPEQVYLHAGVRTGAKALGLADWRDKLPLSAFPMPFQRLRPEQVEDCLCLYKSQLQAWRRAQRHTSGAARNP